MIRTVRQLYVLLALAAAGLAALAGRRMAHALLPLLEKRRKPWLGTGADWVGAIAFILCSISPLYLRYSVLYLSVDIVGCFTTLSALAYFVLHRRETRTLEFAVIGGALIGFALGTKYNYYPLLVPALGIIWVKYRERRILSSTILVLTTIATFLVTTPYALLDLPAFAWSAAGEALHYTVGHQPGMRPVSSHYVPSGAPMFLAYGATVTQNFGPVLILLAAVGVVWCVQKAPLLAFSFGGYPLLLWLYMSKQRAFFDRNLLILQLVVPVFAALGIVWCGAWIGRLVDRRIPSLSRWGRWAIVLPLLFSAVTFPVADAWASLEALRDSRREATDWLKGEKLTVSLILVARELEMDPRTFPRGQRVKTYRASKKSLSALWKEYPNTLVFVPHFEGDSYDRKTYPPIRTFGRRPPAKKRGGMWGANAHVLKGNPKFSVVRLPDREEDP